MPLMFNKNQSEILGKLVNSYCNETLYMLKEEQDKYFVSAVDNDGEEFMVEFDRDQAVAWIGQEGVSAYESASFLSA